MDRISISSFGLVLALTACSSSSTPTEPAGSSGNNSVGTGGSVSGGGHANGTSGAGTTAGSSNTAAGAGGTVAAGGSVAAGGNVATGGAGNGTAGGGTVTAGAGGTSSGGGATGTAGSGPAASSLVTSAQGAFWTTGTWTETTSGTADVTVNDTAAAQAWDGFGAAFNELGWTYLNTTALQTQAMQLLFGTNGAHFAWGRIPMGASDYAVSRYTDDDTGTDPTANTGGTNRPAADTSMANFSLTRDGQNLIPYIKAAQAVNSGLRFWSSPWTPPVWMKTGYDTTAGGSGTAKKPSYFDGGTFVNSAANLTAYAQYYTKFVQGYKAQGINIELVSPQNEPGYEQNYPSCLWDKATYTTWIGQYLGPAMQTLGVKVMLGTLSNNGDSSRTDLDIATAVLADNTAKGFVTVAGAQWGVLDAVNGGTKFGNLPIWATEHKCGNYPWNPSGYPAYNSTQAPNDLAYGVESWGYIRDAITKGKVTSYSAWNMVLNKTGLGNDTSRDWKQDALLVVDGGAITQTPAYYVFRHFSQFVDPKATVVGTTGGDAVAFKNPDGTLVAVIYNSGAAKATFTVAIGGKKVQFAMPGAGWATVKL
jgi:glucosylceramidase